MTSASPHFVVQHCLPPQTDTFGRFPPGVTKSRGTRSYGKPKQILGLVQNGSGSLRAHAAKKSELAAPDVHLISIVMELRLFTGAERAFGQTGGLL